MKREFQIIVKHQVDKELIPQIIKDKIHLEPIAKLLNENIGIYS